MRKCTSGYRHKASEGVGSCTSAAGSGRGRDSLIVGRLVVVTLAPSEAALASKDGRNVYQRARYFEKKTAWPGSYVGIRRTFPWQIPRTCNRADAIQHLSHYQLYVYVYRTCEFAI